MDFVSPDLIDMICQREWAFFFLSLSFRETHVLLHSLNVWLFTVPVGVIQRKYLCIYYRVRARRQACGLNSLSLPVVAFCFSGKMQSFL